MKHIRRYNESNGDTRFDIIAYRWVKDSVIELEEDGFSVSISVHDDEMTIHMYKKSNRLNNGVFDLDDMGEEFIGRIFGMMKDKYNVGTVTFTLYYDYGVTGRDSKVFKFNVKDHDNLDFLTDRWDDKWIEYKVNDIDIGCDELRIKLSLDEIKFYNESAENKFFTREDIHWVEDCVVELEDQYYPISIDSYNDVISIKYYEEDIQDDQSLYFRDLGVEFVGRLFGMMKDRHNNIGRIRFIFDKLYGVAKEVDFNVRDYNNLDFMFDWTGEEKVWDHGYGEITIKLELWEKT